jgi:hypothetical protein
MKNIFTMAGQEAGPGYVVVSHYHLGLYGTFAVYGFCGLKVNGRVARKLEFNMTQAFAWDGAFESSLIPAHIRGIDPKDRLELQTYMPRTVSEMDLIPTPPDGRFMFSHTPRTTSSGIITASIDYDHGGEGVYITDQEEMLEYLGGHLFYWGVPKGCLQQVNDHLTIRFHAFEMDL